MTKSYFGFDKLQTEILVFEEAESVDLRTADDGNAPPFPGSLDGKVPDISETFGAGGGASEVTFEAVGDDVGGHDPYVFFSLQPRNFIFVRVFNFFKSFSGRPISRNKLLRSSSS
jgi:hypothetical protein